jgi:hypothetical protein
MATAPDTAGVDMDVPIIACTAQTDPEVAEKSRRPLLQHDFQLPIPAVAMLVIRGAEGGGNGGLRAWRRSREGRKEERESVRDPAYVDGKEGSFI